MIDEQRSANPVLRLFVWISFFGVILRFVDIWAIAAGYSLPRIGSVGFTLIFSVFSLLHASSVLGWRRAVWFLVITVVVSWLFEEIGVATGLVYGHYHYSMQLGAKVGAVPLIVPLAWFMMIYASWIVARVLMQGAGNPTSRLSSIAVSLVASAVMTSWDVVMDPGMAHQGTWVWEQGGLYFGVPFQNFVGWMLTTFTVYLLATVLLPRSEGSPRQAPLSRLYAGLPVLAYALVAADRVLIASVPELHVVAAFGMGFLAMLAILRLILSPEPLSLEL